MVLFSQDRLAGIAILFLVSVEELGRVDVRWLAPWQEIFFLSFFSNRLLLTTRVVTRLVQPPGKLDVQTVFAALSSWKVVAPCFTVKLQSDRSLK